uniref:UDP-galactose transporter n=1 Tax=Globodera rostochiensis TaxID=31243 RepID=A0A914HGT6_GLORO
MGLTSIAGAVFGHAAEHDQQQLGNVMTNKTSTVSHVVLTLPTEEPITVEQTVAEAATNTTTTAKQPETTGRRLPSMGKVLKYVSLLVLVLMLAVKIMYTRFATVQPHSQPFLKTALVFWSEVAKFGSALAIFTFFTGPVWSAPRRLYDQFNWLDTMKLGVPAFVYTVQNFLFLAALENLDASTFSVLDQMKILTTALFTVIILRRRISLAQWTSLMILMAGVIIVQYNAQEDVKAKAKDQSLVQNGTSTELLLNRTHALTATAAAAPPPPHDINGTHPPAMLKLISGGGGGGGGGGTHDGGLALLLNGTTTNGTRRRIVTGQDKQKLKSFDHSKQRPLYGLICVILGNFGSGFAGVYVEKMLKSRSSVSIWVQNVQLAALAMPISLAMVAIQDWHKVWHNGGLNQGFDLIVWGVVATQTMSGLCIAVVIKYADNILKTFANSMPKPLFMLGAAFIITAALLYAKFPYRAKPKPDQASTSNSSTDSSTADSDSNNRTPTKQEQDKISRLSKLFRMGRSPTMAQLTPGQLNANNGGDGGPQKI